LNPADPIFVLFSAASVPRYSRKGKHSRQVLQKRLQKFGLIMNISKRLFLLLSSRFAISPRKKLLEKAKG
jgi:hypothetical protein